MNGVGGDGGSFKTDQGLIRVDLNEVDEEVGTNGEGTVPDDIVGRDGKMAALSAEKACFPRAAAMR